jgi:hypothetical protein
VPQEVIDAPARMPALYQHAVVAIKECDQVDECKTWADKMEALASYARQAHDDTLLKLATRIQGRAMQRVGELLKEIKPSKGGRPRNGETSAGAHTSLTRTQAATEAGLSDHQRKTALRVASIPPAEFEAAVESDKPPTVTELAERESTGPCLGIAAPIASPHVQPLLHDQQRRGDPPVREPQRGGGLLISAGGYLSPANLGQGRRGRHNLRAMSHARVRRLSRSDFLFNIHLRDLAGAAVEMSREQMPRRDRGDA